MNGITSSGAKGINALGQRYKGKYHPLMEIGPRYLLIQGTHRELTEGNGPPFALDLPHIDRDILHHLQYDSMPGDKETWNDYCALCSMAAVWLMVFLKPGLAPRLPKSPLHERMASLKTGLPIMGIFFLVIGGIYGGIVSPTEAAGVSVVYALLIGVVAYREINFKKFIKCLVDTGHTATPVMLILGICIVFGRVLSMLRIPQTLATFVTSNIESKIAVLLAINLFLLVAGMLMDTIPCILILAPIFLPIVQAYNVDIVHFGILMTCNLAIGFVTPPIGTNLFVAQSLTKIPITRIAKHAVPFLAMFLVALLVITFVPSVSLWLPSVLSK